MTGERNRPPIHGDETDAEMPHTSENGASPAPREYTVGYAKPPKSTRFKAGKSGNPKGRKKLAPNVAQQIDACLAQKIRVTESGKQKSLSRQQVMLTSIANNASKGDLKSAGFLLHLRATHREEKSPTIDPELLDAENAALLSSFVAQMSAGEELPQEGATADEISQCGESKPSASTNQRGPEMSTVSVNAASAAGGTVEHGLADPNADRLASDLSSAQAEFSTGPIDSDRNLLPGQNQTSSLTPADAASPPQQPVVRGLVHRDPRLDLTAAAPVSAGIVSADRPHAENIRIVRSAPVPAGLRIQPNDKSQS